MPTNDEAPPSPVLDAVAAHARQLAHDLGNPLSALSLSLELLEQTELSATQARYVARCQSACERLLVDQRRLTALAGGYGQQAGWHDLLPLCEAAARRLHRSVVVAPAPAEGRSVRVCLEAEATRIYGVELLLEEALTIVLQNADDAAPEAPIQLHARPEAGGIDVTIADRGPGPSNQQLPFLFRAHGTTRPRGGGLGLVRLALLVERQAKGRVQYGGHTAGVTSFVLWWPSPAPR